MKESDARKSWATGLDDEGARALAADLVRYFESVKDSMPEKGEATSVARTWRDLLDSPQPSAEVANQLSERMNRRSGGSAWLELQLGLAAWIRWRWGGPFDFTYRLSGSGWSEAYVAQADQWLRPTASYLTDALTALVSAIIAVIEGNEHVACIWEEEPGEYLWWFERVSDLVELRSMWRSNWSNEPSNADRWFLPKENEAGDLKLRLRTSSSAIGSAVLSSLDQLWTDPGPTAYEQIWGKPFPEAEHKRLRELVGLS